MPSLRQQPVDKQQAQVSDDDEDGGEGGGDIHGYGDDDGIDAAEHDEVHDDGDTDKTGDSAGQLRDSPRQQLPDEDEALDAVQSAGKWSVNAQPETNGQSDTDQQAHGDGHASHTGQEAKPGEMKYRLPRQKRVDYTFAGMTNKRRFI
jgi:hypothetical protein